MQRIILRLAVTYRDDGSRSNAIEGTGLNIQGLVYKMIDSQITHKLVTTSNVSNALFITFEGNDSYNL